MENKATAPEAGKRRSQRSPDVLQEYLKVVDSERASLVAQREYLQAKLDLIERQKANFQEVIEIEEKLAQMGRRSPGAPETSGEGGSQAGEVVFAS